jgi:GntP family gluconate:H+ symporter
VASEGFGKTLENIAIIIACGAIIGTALEESKASQKIADSFIKVLGINRVALAVSLIGWLTSFLIFCDTGFIIFSGLIKDLSAKSKEKIERIAISLSTGLYASHSLMIPAAGPVATAFLLGADIGTVMLLGIIPSLFAVMVGYLWAKIVFKDKRILVIEKSKEKIVNISFLRCITPIILPIIFIASGSLLKLLGTSSYISKLIIQLSHPIIAIIAGLISAIILLPSNGKKEQWSKEGLAKAAPIILLTGAGGALGTIIEHTNIIDPLSTALMVTNAGLIFPFIIASIMKIAQGSTTVALITTPAIVSPLLENFGLNSTMGLALTALSIGSGALIFSHINDSYFWVVNQFSGIDIKSTYKGHSAGTFLEGLGAFFVIYLLSLFL